MPPSRGDPGPTPERRFSGNALDGGVGALAISAAQLGAVAVAEVEFGHIAVQVILATMLVHAPHARLNIE